MKRSYFIAGITAAAMALGATSVYAMGPGHEMHGPRPSFSDLDTDGNGEVTKQEMRGHRQARFDKADTDGDGKLSLDEITAAAQARAAERASRMLEQFDADGDGALSAAEMPGPRAPAEMIDRMFARADADDSGSISQEEFDTMKERMRGKGRFGERHGPDGHGPKMRHCQSD